MTEDLLSSYTRPVKAPERTIVGRETEMRRMKAALMRPELCNVMLLADAGSGKANPVDTPVPVFDSRGIARLGDLRPGNYVFDENGRPVRVLHVFPQGVIPAFEVEFEDGRTCICNDGHLWNVRTEAERKSGDEYKTVTLRYLSKGFSDFPVYIPRGSNIGWPERDFAIHPYVMGIRIGLAYRAGFDKSGPVLSPDVLDLIRKLGGVRDAEELVRLVPLDGGRIPPEYMTGAVSQRYDLLAGVMDVAGDLSLDGNLVSVSLRSDGSALFGDIRDLAATAGWHMRLRGDTLSFAVHWGNICCVFRRRDYRDRIKAAIARWDGNYPFEPDYRDLEITAIRSLDTDLDMVCIYVDSREHLFRITRSGLVTHNTALVQGLMVEDSDRKYLEVDLSRMIADSKDSNEMAAKLKLLFDQVASEVKTKRQDIVLFIDEFHQIVQLSAAAVEALKPLLADSGTRGIRVIAATTYIEFRKYISPNQPLVERLQRINLPEPDKKTVIAILKGMADRYGVGGLIIGDGLYDLIYEYTNRYIPANAQPRKSILVLDAMIGWYRSTGRSLDDRLLADVLYESEGVNVAFRVNASDIRAQLDKRVLSQKFATKMIEQRLQICIADLNNKKRPMSSFLLSGASGTGKEIANSTLVPVFSPDGSVFFKRNGDLVPGDFVFNRKGEPVRVLGVFPQGRKPVYEVELTDGRVLPAGAKHLWQYKGRRGNGAKHWRVADTETLMDKMARPGSVQSGRHGSDVRFVIPMNRAVQWPEADLPVDPYVLGVFIGNGSLREKPLSLSSADRFVVDEVALRIGANGVYKDPCSYTWTFYLPEGSGNGRTKKFYTADVFTGAAAGLVGLYSHEKFIPAEYRHASIEQRWALVRGLFDTDGHIGSNSRYNVSYSSTSRQLVLDIQQVLYSLGVSSRISNRGVRKGRTGNVHDEWHLHVMVGNQDKFRFFSLPRKLTLCDEAVRFEGSKQRVKKFHETVGIRAIRKMDRSEEMTCIYVDDEEHLYQAGDFIVTHNTEVTKTLAETLFGSEDALLRFDMTEFANPDSLERFRTELTNRVWARPFSIVLLDEIEKACAPVTRLLLQVLDDGRLSDENNRIVSFLNCYIVMTTNAGSEVYKNIGQYNVDDEGSGDKIMEYYKVIRESIMSTTGDNKFPPELLGRIDVIVPFQPLSEETMKKIAVMNLKKMMASVKRRHNVDVAMDKRVVRYLVEDNLDTDADSGGARVVISKMESEVTIPIAKYINEHPRVRALNVRVDGTLVRDDPSLRVSDARVVVTEDTSRYR